MHYQLKCLDAETGQTIWSKEHDRANTVGLSQATYAHGRILYDKANLTGVIFSVDLSTGDEFWSATYPSQGFDFIAPTVWDYRVVSGGGRYGGMFGYDFFNPDPAWFVRLDQIDYWSPSLYNDTVVYGDQYIVAAWDIYSGERLWMVQLPQDGARYYPRATVIDTVGNLIYSIRSDNIFCIDISKQAIIWEKKGQYGEEWDWPPRNPSIYHDFLYVVDTTAIKGYHGRTGELRWRLEGYQVTYEMAIANGILFASSDTLTVAVDAATGEVLWECDTGGRLSIANNSLHITNRDGWIYVYGAIATGLDDESSEAMPENYRLSQNYPNPFNPITTIEYILSQPADVKLVVYNILGQEVKTLVSERQSTGEHVVHWNASAWASGIYFYRLTTSDFVQTKKMVLLK